MKTSQAFVHLVGVAAFATMSTSAQAPISRVAPEAPPVHATMNQLMRGVQFPLSNVVFSAQGDDPATVKQDPRPSAATNPLASVFGGWQAVENSSLALAESASLLTLPGRRCANGKPVPVQNADWIAFVQGFREASLAAYDAAKSKNQDRILEVSERLADSCTNCHRVYRKTAGEQGDLSARCSP